MYGASIWATLYHASTVLIHNALGTKRFREVADHAPTRWGVAVLKSAGVRVEVEGFEHYEAGRAQVLVSNHASWFDVFALSAVLPPGFRFVAKQELSKIPIFGPSWVAAGHYAVDRSNREAAVASLKEAGQLIRQGKHTLVMFPEGTRSDDGRLKPFKKGAFVLAINSGAPILPVAVLGSREVMAKGSWVVRPGTITVRFGAPISTEGMDATDRDRLTALGRRAVAELLGEALEDEPATPRLTAADARTEDPYEENRPSQGMETIPK